MNNYNITESKLDESQFISTVVTGMANAYFRVGAYLKSDNSRHFFRENFYCYPITRL